MVGKKVLHKARWREILWNYKSFLSIILIAVLCVALFTGLFANYKNFQIRVNHFYDSTNMADYFVTTKSYDEGDLEKLSDIVGIKKVEQRAYLPLQKENKTFTLIGVEENHTISKPIIKSGEEGVLVSPTLLENMDCKIGDTIEFEINELPFPLPIRFTITGIMQHPEDIEKNSIYSGLIYTSIDTLKNKINESIGYPWIQKENLFNQFVITGKDNVLEDIQRYYIDKPNSNLLSALARDSFPTNSSIDMDVVQARQLLFVFPLVFYLVGVLVIITSLKELIHKERKNIGVLSALGFSKGEIILHYSYISIILVSIGSLIGTIIGPLLIPRIMGRKYNVLYNLPQTNLPFAYVEYLFFFLIIVLVSIISSIMVSYKEVNRTPAVILRNEVQSNLKQSNFKTHKSLLALKMSFRNMRLNKIRSFMVFIGVLGCSALLACGFGIDNTLDYSVIRETDELVPYDLQISYDRELNLETIPMKEIDYYNQQSIIALHSNKSYNTSLYVFEEKLEIFKPKVPFEGCMISKRLSEDLNLKIGDEIEYIYDNERFMVEVKAIQELSFTSGIFIVTHDSNFIFNRAYICVKDKDTISNVKEEILSLGATSVMTNAELKNHADNIFSGIRGITLTVKIFAVLLALVVIYNLAQLNYKERIRDIATLKVLGFGKLEIAQTLLYELTTLTLIGSVVGMFLGKPLLILLLKINQTSRFTYIYYISPMSYFIAIALTLFISIIINLFITKLSDKIEMVESLKSVE